MDADGLLITEEPKSRPNCGENRLQEMKEHTQPQGESIGNDERSHLTAARIDKETCKRQNQGKGNGKGKT